MISRRTFGIGVVVMAGDGLVRGVGAPAGQATPIGVQAGVSNSIDFARAVVVFGPAGSVLGVYVYSPGTTPGPGNPPIMSMGNSSVDLYGNAIHPGISSQIPGGNWVSLFQGQIEFQGGSAISGTSGGNLVFQTAADFAFIGGPVLSETASGGTAANPTIITTDTWHPMALLNSWTSGGRMAPQYQLQPSGEVEIRGSLTAPAGVASGQNVWAGGGYAPASAQSLVARNVTTNAAVMFSVTTAGDLVYQAGMAAGNVADFCYSISLTA